MRDGRDFQRHPRLAQVGDRVEREVKRIGSRQGKPASLAISNASLRPMSDSLARCPYSLWALILHDKSAKKWGRVPCTGLCHAAKHPATGREHTLF